MYIFLFILYKVVRVSESCLGKGTVVFAVFQHGQNLSAEHRGKATLGGELGLTGALFNSFSRSCPVRK